MMCKISPPIRFLIVLKIFSCNPRNPPASCKNGVTYGFTYETMKLLTLNNSLSFCIGKSDTTDPSIYLWLEVGNKGTICPDSYLHISSTGENM